MEPFALSLTKPLFLVIRYTPQGETIGQHKKMISYNDLIYLHVVMVEIEVHYLVVCLSGSIGTPMPNTRNKIMKNDCYNNLLSHSSLVGQTTHRACTKLLYFYSNKISIFGTRALPRLVRRWSHLMMICK